MMVVDKLYKKLQESNEESKMVQNANKMKLLRSKTDSDFTHLLKIVKDIKGKLEALDESNVEHRKIPGCGPGSSADRTRTSIVSGLANDELIENLISSGNGEDFLQKAIQDQGRGQIMDTISEIQERHDAIIEIEKNLIELYQIFLDMAVLVGPKDNS
ncbi:hypothetical protein L1987_16933 [Smallanthus sonchifolius]|uniref:Uncharacterized protein n=1 Tax=Smallanthus sonchifolius TaxID=185202 RepID=A0ACB9IWJ1_9ASTR|nr:hypothetical protein L1987_16933 [Smallanthus sonchifolius]